MRKSLQAVQEFHEAFGLGIQASPCAELPAPLVELRYKLMKEENEEYLAAAKEGKILDIADALGDMLYVLCGTLIEHGLQDKITEVFSEIHRSNMSKLGPDKKPVYKEDGKVAKGPHYRQPDLRKILGENP